MREEIFPFLIEEDFINLNQEIFVHIANLRALRNDPEGSDQDEDEDLVDVNYKASDTEEEKQIRIDNAEGFQLIEAEENNRGLFRSLLGRLHSRIQDVSENLERAQRRFNEINLNNNQVPIANEEFESEEDNYYDDEDSDNERAQDNQAQNASSSSSSSSESQHQSQHE